MTKPNKGKLLKQSKFSKYRDISNSVKVKFGSRKESEPTYESDSYDGNEKSDLETLIENMLGLPSTDASYLNRSIDDEIRNLDWAKDSNESIFLMPNRRGFNRLKIDYGAIEKEYKAFSAGTKSQYRKLFELIDRFEESDLIRSGKKFRIIGYKKESSGHMNYITVPGSRSFEPSVKIFRSLQSIRVVDDFAETFIASHRSEKQNHNILSDHWYSALKDCIEISEYDEILDEIDKQLFDIIFSSIKEERRPSIWSIKSYRPHFGRWFLSSSEISVMIKILEALISMNSLLLDFFKRESPLQFSRHGVKGHIPCIVENPDGKHYIERVPIDIGVSHAFFSDPVVIDDSLGAKIADLSRKPKNPDAKWEIGVNILMNEVQEDGRVPYYPELVLCFDCDLKRCIFNYLGALHLEKGRAEFYQRFVSFLSSLDHLPATIKVFPEFKSLFVPFKSLFAIEEFKDGDLEIFQKENLHCCEILEELYLSHDIPIELGEPLEFNPNGSLSDLVSLDLFYQKHKKTDKHLRVFSAIKKRFPDSGAVPFLFGMVQYYNHSNERALEHFEKARELRYTHAEMENAMGIISIERGDFLGAEPYFYKAISLDSTCAEAYYNIAMIKGLFRNLLEAEKYLLKAIECNRTEGLYYLSLAKVMIDPEVQKYRRSISQVGQKLNSMIFYNSDKNFSFLQKLNQEYESIFKLYGHSMADLFNNRVEIYKSISKLVR
jgi:tetratricopeptide (TPR) repeat protein